MVVEETVSHAFALMCDGMFPDPCDLGFSGYYHIPLSLHEKDQGGTTKVFSYLQKRRNLPHIMEKEKKE